VRESWQAAAARGRTKVALLVERPGVYNLRASGDGSASARLPAAGASAGGLNILIGFPGLISARTGPEATARGRFREQTMILRARMIAVAAAIGACVGVGTEHQAAEVYAPLGVEAARTAALQWARTRPDYSPEAEPLLARLWEFGDQTATPTACHDAALRSFYLVDPEVRRVVDACQIRGEPIDLSAFAALQTSVDEPFYIQNLRAFCARFLAVTRRYDDALELYDEIDPAQLIDPATSQFYRAVCEHALLMKAEGLATLAQLLDQTQGVPTRYRTLAELMKHDLEGLREKTLGEVARQMADVERRLHLGHAGQRVQRQEERIIATLDELIKKLEQQQGGGGGGGSGESQGGAPQNAADESYVGGQKGPGEVEAKPLGHEAGWGNLPDKDQAQVKNMLDKQFPSHYRQAVTEYLRKLGQRPAPTPR